MLFSEIEKEIVPNEQPVEVALCVHHQSPYEHMCINCDELLCASCLQEHRNHSMTPICDMVFQFYSGKLKDLAGKVEAKVQSWSCSQVPNLADTIEFFGLRGSFVDSRSPGGAFERVRQVRGKD